MAQHVKVTITATIDPGEVTILFGEWHGQVEPRLAESIRYALTGRRVLRDPEPPRLRTLEVTSVEAVEAW